MVLLRTLLAAGCVAQLAGCAAPGLPPCQPGIVPPLAVQVVDHGWHTDLALPADGLTGGLRFFRRFFPGLRVLLVGFGKRSFMTSPARGLADYLVGPLPGDAVLLVAGLTASPAQAYGDGTVATVELSASERDRLDRFVWNSFTRDAEGRPEPIGSAFFPGSVFFAATPGYSGWHTCNTWTAEALHAAGLPLSASGVVFAGQAMARAMPLARGGICRIGAPAAAHPGA